MSFKVVRVGGAVVAFGPNEPWYEPAQAYEIEEEPPVADPKELIKSELAALLAQAKLQPGQEWLLDVAMASMISAGATQGLTEPQLYLANPGYSIAKDLAAQVAQKLAQL